jgi:UDP-3-O-[3-hydroxymyristoyl] glucosamine N-acyltransferase
MITAGAILSREVMVGKNCLVGPNASIRDKIIIGEGVVIGIGSVVVKNLDAYGIYAGNPARFLRKA